ncbi:hypothetical protein HK102_012885 [Quaeritorhiza haematococci]|nr:hypothetical protein HK102_012885 [Quaeritorhiza haematococci]
MAKGTKTVKAPLPTITAWLILYNFASLAGWAYSLYLLVRSVVPASAFSGGKFELAFDKAYEGSGWVVTVVQTGALLEVFHSLFGFVRTPVATTAMQVASRLLLVWGVCYPFDVPEVRLNVAYTTMVIAWSITEVIRYLYYGLNLLGSQPGWLLWCRYTFFFVLYPLGAGSEWWLLTNAFDAARKLDERVYWAFYVMSWVYAPGFYIMYTHMIGQRRKYLGGASKAKSAKTKAKKAE